MIGPFDPPRPRQAVVIIHGIGEQRPMETLRSFVRGVVVPSRDALSKPDRISTTLELRRLAVPGRGRWSPGEPVSTDFYELYWAHLMTGTSWSHVTAWARTLMLRGPGKIPPRLQSLWLVTWLVVAAAAALIYGAWRPSLARWPFVAAIAAAAVALAKSSGSYFGLQYMGDAARYLSPTPPNIGVRHAIRSAALDVLRGLHDDPLRRYHRIIVVGHSLGSVIGYDALTYLWQERHHPADRNMRSAPQPDHGRLEKQLSLEEGRELQGRLWREQRAIGVSWKITDFITLGSPLAHAPFLMARDQKDFDERKWQRELPSCPPQREDHRDRDYGRLLLRVVPGPGSGECKLLHHAALFACTRWTNLYFHGDLVGGPLGAPSGKPELFGSWIDDQPLQSSAFFPHTRYWNETEKAPLEALRKALDLDGWWTPENTATAMARTES